MIGTWRVLEHHLMVYRRTWKGGMFVSFASPILFLAAMGIGLGSLIARGPVRTVGGVSYLAFLAPGLLAATAMQTAFVEETYPIMAKLQWLRTYDGMLATPLTIGNLLGGEIGWLAVRQAITAITFFIVLVIFGTVSSVAAVLMIPVAVLNGLAFGLPIMAFSATQRKDKGFPVIVGIPGHILVVRGGDSNYVYLVDSAPANQTRMTHAEFLSLWNNFSVLFTPQS